MKGMINISMRLNDPDSYEDIENFMESKLPGIRLR